MNRVSDEFLKFADENKGEFVFEEAAQLMIKDLIDSRDLLRKIAACRIIDKEGYHGGWKISELGKLVGEIEKVKERVK